MILSRLFRKSRPPEASRLPPFRPRKPVPLSPDQVEGLRNLVKTPAWRHYSAVVEQVWEQETERVLRGLAQDEYQKTVGFLSGLRKAVSLPDHLLQAADAAAKDLERVQSRPLADLAQRLRDATVGTRWFRPTDS
jgi:hypothetical protein